MSTLPSGEKPRFVVTGQRHTTVYDADRQEAAEGLEIYFDYGEPTTQGKVFVPGAKPSVDAARVAILDYIEQGRAIQQLTG